MPSLTLGAYMARPSRTGGKTSEAKARNASPAKGHKTTKTKRRLAPAGTRAKRRSPSGPSKDLKEAREQQAATAEILRVINSSKGDLTPVFNIILEKAHGLCDVPCGSLQLFDDGHTRAVAVRGMTEPFEKFLRQGYRLDQSQPVQSGRSFQIDDLTKVMVGASHGSPLRVAIELGGLRTMLSVPLVRDGVVFGRIVAGRQEVRPFSEHQIAVLQTFADQAVIAIENARLFNETKEALERQTATADILKVIASSPSDVQPVFAAIANSANRLLGGFSTAVFRFLEGDVHLAAFTPTNPAADKVLTTRFPQSFTEFPAFDWVRGGAVAQIADVESGAWPGILDLARARGFRAMLLTPLMSNGIPIGLISVTRRNPGSFAEHHVQLLQTFADQAVIAIENVRLFNEVKQRTDDLSESLQQQTATSDVLKVISRSAFDLQAVLDTLVESAGKLCNATMTNIWLRDGDVLRAQAQIGLSETFSEFLRTHPIARDRGKFVGRAFLTGELVHLPDVLADPEYTFVEAPTIGQFRSALGVPLIRQGQVEGVFALARPEPGGFTDREIELVRTFVDQALIAIENARLFNETQEALERQTATADILKVIASSPDDVQPVFEAIAERAKRLVGAHAATVLRVVGDRFELGAFTPVSEEADATLRASFPLSIANNPQFEMAYRGEITEVADTELEMYAYAKIRDIARARGFRSRVLVPLRSDNGTVGAISVTRTEPGSFATHHVQLLQTFADQAVIAIENTRLFEQVQAKTRDLTESLEQQTATSEVLEVISASTGESGAGFPEDAGECDPRLRRGVWRDEFVGRDPF